MEFPQTPGGIIQGDFLPFGLNLIHLLIWAEPRETIGDLHAAAGLMLFSPRSWRSNGSVRFWNTAENMFFWQTFYCTYAFLLNTIILTNDHSFHAFLQSTVNLQAINGQGLPSVNP